MAYQLDLEKGILELDLGNITSYDFIEETNLVSKQLKTLKPITLKKFEIKVKGIDFQKILEPILFHSLFEIIDNLSENKFPISVFWYYKNKEELEMGNEMNDVLNTNVKFEFIQIT